MLLKTVNNASAFLFDVWLAEFVVLVGWFNFDVVVLFYFYIFIFFLLFLLFIGFGFCLACLFLW